MSIIQRFQTVPHYYVVLFMQNTVAQLVLFFASPQISSQKSS